MWIASFAGSLRYIDPDALESGWQVKTPDEKKLWVGNKNPDSESALSQRAFSLTSFGNLLWVGTANGIFYSTDSGESFTNLSYSNTGLSGDFITFLTHHNGVVYANSRITSAGQENALNRFDFNNYTDQNSVTWEKSYLSDWVYSISFKDNFILVGTEKSGLFIESGNIETPYNLSSFKDSDTDELIAGSGIFASLLQSDNSVYRFWIGTSEGIAKSNDHGKTWDLYKAKSIYTSVEGNNAVAYPSPYNPKHTEKLLRFSFPSNGIGKLSIYNFGMEKVYESNSLNSGSNDIGTFTWDGINKFGDYVSNGVYFFQVETDEKSYWNKFIILN